MQNISEDEQENYETFRDCLSDILIQNLTIPEPKRRKRAKSVKGGGLRKDKKKNDTVDATAGTAKTSNAGDAEELAEFIEYLASEIFPSLPQDMRQLSYSAVQNNTGLASRYSLPLSKAASEALLQTVPVSASDSLSTYLSKEPSAMLIPPLEAYISSVAAPPPVWSTTRASACELCERSYIPLTYHHLIPRFVHAKAIKRGWHEEWELNKVAWLCRACHSLVHRVCTHEELAKEYHTVERLLEREDVQAFVQWVGRVRWKKR